MQPPALPRIVALEGASNLRDLGGWRTADGRVVRAGKLFRSAALDRLTAADQAVLAGLGLKTVCDFRGAEERARALTRLDGVAQHSLPVEPTVGVSFRDILAMRQPTRDELMRLLHLAYEGYALAANAQYRAFFALLREPTNLALLFHCSAGKDRTGFAAALVLCALGVAWESVVEDYLATNLLWRGDPSLSPDLPDVLRETMLTAHAEALEAAFTAIRRRDGSVDAYLDRALGVDDAVRTRLRDQLLE